MDPSLTLALEPPSVDEFMSLRERAGLSPRSTEGAAIGLPASWAAATVRDEAGEALGMGRLVGDGGCALHLVDMAVLPEQQRRGIGTAILEALLAEIRERAPAGVDVSLLADPPGRDLYRRFGFVETAPGEVGMALREDPAHT